jgi:hypothetical protein
MSAGWLSVSGSHQLFITNLQINAQSNIGLNINIANKSVENAAQFIHLGSTVMDQNYIHEEVSKLNS